MIKKIVIGLIVLALSSGCIGIGSDKIEKASVGQELIDLKKAKDAGAISEQEYLQLKQKIMDMQE